MSLIQKKTIKLLPRSMDENFMSLQKKSLNSFALKRKKKQQKETFPYMVLLREFRARNF